LRDLITLLTVLFVVPLALFIVVVALAQFIASVLFG
jgi:hypothetical protein